MLFLLLCATQEEVALRDTGAFGTCATLEKDYFRLTSMPRACDVRPPSILAAALKHVKKKWLEQGDYHYACSQLKSIRQVRAGVCVHVCVRVCNSRVGVEAVLIWYGVQTLRMGSVCVRSVAFGVLCLELWRVAYLHHAVQQARHCIPV